MASSDSSRRASYVNSGSILLKDMLKEKKAQMHRQTSGQRNVLDTRNIQSSPIPPMSRRDASSSSGRRSSGMRVGSGPKEMGVREMEDVRTVRLPTNIVADLCGQHVSHIKNQNFDLKLELFHLRQKNEQLEAALVKVPELEADNKELQSINDELLLELEKRDVAIQEAVELICERERQIEEMGEAETYFLRNAKPQEQDLASRGDSAGLKERDSQPQLHAENADAGGQAQAGLSPPRLQTSSPTPSKTSRRVPSFIQEPKKSTKMLRSLYLDDGSQVQADRSSGSFARPGSLYSGEDEEDDHMLNSPRLSVLSESGFSSIYGSKERSQSPPQSHAGHPEEHPHYDGEPPRTDQREARLQKWLVERDRPTTPAQQTTSAPFSSIGQVLEDVPDSSRAREPGTLRHDEQEHRAEPNPNVTPKKKSRAHHRKPSSPTFGGPMFGGSLLPPTPDTLSTTTTAASSSTPSIVTEKSLLDGAPYRPRVFSASTSDGRPHTSGSSVASTFGTALVYTQPARSNCSREEQGSTQKYISSGSQSQNSSRPLHPRSSSSHSATRPVRPSLTSSATDTTFYVDGNSPTHVSRTLSYPAPGGRPRHPTNQLSPVSSKGSNSHSEKTPTASPRNWTSTSSNAGTPSRLTRNMHQRSSTATRDVSSPTPTVDSQSETSPSPQRSSSLRSKMAKVSLTPSKSTQQSIASRLFRRTNSQSKQNPASNQISTQTNIPSKPPAAHARLPRPSSLYASSPANGQKPLPPTPTEEKPIYELATYELSPMLPGIMLTGPETHSSSRNRRQRSTRR